MSSRYGARLEKFKDESPYLHGLLYKGDPHPNPFVTRDRATTEKLEYIEPDNAQTHQDVKTPLATSISLSR